MKAQKFWEDSYEKSLEPLKQANKFIFFPNTRLLNSV